MMENNKPLYTSRTRTRETGLASSKPLIEEMLPNYFMIASPVVLTPGLCPCPHWHWSVCLLSAAGVSLPCRSYLSGLPAANQPCWTGCQPVWPESVIDRCSAAAWFPLAARPLRQRWAQSPPPGFMNHSVHRWSYLCARVATHLAAVPLDRPGLFYDSAGSPDEKSLQGRDGVL